MISLECFAWQASKLFFQEYYAMVCKMVSKIAENLHEIIFTEVLEDTLNIDDII